MPGITPKDADDIRFGLDNDIDFIAASFVRKAQDVLDIREILEEKDMTHVQIFPKIESQEGIDNIDEIIKVSDGVMIARGDMGVEIPAELVPMVQNALSKMYCCWYPSYHCYTNVRINARKPTSNTCGSF